MEISANGEYSCEVPDGAYCAGANSNIIIRCTDGVGRPGNCNDNLAGYPPLGVGFSLCLSCGLEQGIAACSKDGTVYGDSGAGFGDVQFPVNSSEAACSAAAKGEAYGKAPSSMAPYTNATSTTGRFGGMGTAAPSVYGSAPTPTSASNTAGASESDSTSASTSASESGSTSTSTSAPDSSEGSHGDSPYAGAASALQAAGTIACLGALFVALNII